MKSLKIKMMIALAILGFSSGLYAVSVTYTGADLLSVAEFPSATPTLLGTSLLFDTSEAQHLQLFSLPVDVLDGRVKIVLDLTRPACSDGGCAGGAEDFDPNMALSDGNFMVGAIMADNFNGQALAANYSDQGYYAHRYGSFASLFENAGYPQIGDSVEVTLEFVLDSAGTQVDIAYLDGAGSYIAPPLAATGSYAFVFMRDNDSGERYQINSVTIFTGPDVVEVAADIKPGSCPNPLNAESANGVVSVAINGDTTINITDIDPASVRLAGVAPLRWNHEDVSTPYTPYIGKTNRLDCHAAGDDDTLRDGLLDLVFKFDKASLIAALGGSNLANGATVVVPLTGTLRDGTPIVGEDVVWIRTGDNDD